MSSYKVEASQYDDDFVWSVIETSTNQIIREFIFEEEARLYSRFLNGGGAFNGFTPPFILNEVVFTNNINEKFIFSVA